MRGAASKPLRWPPARGTSRRVGGVGPLHGAEVLASCSRESSGPSGAGSHAARSLWDGCGPYWPCHRICSVVSTLRGPCFRLVTACERYRFHHERQGSAAHRRLICSGDFCGRKSWPSFRVCPVERKSRSTFVGSLRAAPDLPRALVGAAQGVPAGGLTHHERHPKEVGHDLAREQVRLGTVGKDLGVLDEKDAVDLGDDVLGVVRHKHH